VAVGGTADGKDAEFSASGTVITFPGFLAAYEEGKDESRGDDDSEEARRLPNVAKGDSLTAADIIAVGHETSPPPRYTEA
jgi:DNA topoisomerase-1